ncbi:MAG: cytochrome b N-terminal domain-containing protein [bacterium]|nr:cytochrome b N-terminal domain-containing protein [bacterium]
MLNWIESRTGFVSMAKDFLTEDIPGGASYWYVFGSATIFAMSVQIVTGIFLTFFYAPSATTAWESTRAIYLNPFTHFLISIHYWGASAMIALVFLHMLQVLIWGAYKSPRELQWIVGVILLVVTLVLGLTGYLLPWDMNAYFASQVALNITGTAPIAGPLIQNIAQGGGVMGTNTINRFFGLHVWLMPAALVALVGAHLAIFRHNGPAGPISEDPRTLKPGRFWPDQMFMDGFISFLIFLVIVALAIFSPPFLDAKADPTNSTFVAYPAWYFLFLFEALDLTPPAFQLLTTIVGPTLGLIVIILLPWLDRSTTRSIASRKGVIWATIIVVAGIITLSTMAQLRIQHEQSLAGPAESQAQILAAAEPAAAAETTGSAAATGGAAAGGADLAHGQQVFSQNCSSCHGANGQGQAMVAPPLAGNPMVTGDPKAVIGVLVNGLHGQTIMGQSYAAQMPAWKGQLSTKDIADVISYIRGGLGTNKAAPVKESDIK